MIFLPVAAIEALSTLFDPKLRLRWRMQRYGEPNALE